MPSSPSKCAIPACQNAAAKRGWCIKHYTRWVRHGDPQAGGYSRGNAQAFLKMAVHYEGDDCLVWPHYRDANGYARVNFEGRDQLASRIVCRLKWGEPHDGQNEAAHTCGKGHEGCINPIHLRWASYSENNLEKQDHGTMMRGEEHCCSKLLERDIPTIRDRLKCGVSFAIIAADYGVSRSSIANIKYGKAWAWLK